MWLKNLDEIAKYLPIDELFHDVQVIGDAIYVDGEHQNPYMGGSLECIGIIDRALTDEEVLTLFRKEAE